MTSQVAHRHPSLAIRRTTIVIVLLSMVTSLFGPWTDIPAEAAGDPSDRAELTSVVRTNPAANVPFVAGSRISDYVSGVVELGDTVIVAGRFPSVRNPGSGTSIPRANIFAYSKSTGLVSNSFVPAVNGTIDAMAAGPDGQSVIIGGSFSTVNGEPSFGLARLNISNGQRVAGWNTTTQGRVRDLIVRGNNLYLGGDFWNVGGQPRERLAKVNATTGAVDPSFNVAVGAPRAGTHDWVTSLDISADGSTMVIVGNFIDVGGQPRVQVALIDIPGNSVLPWSTQGYASACSSSFWTYMRDIEFSPDDDYFVAVTTGGPFLGTLCDTAARWEHEPATSGANASWVNWSGGDTLTAVAVTTGAVYIGGHQRWMNNHSGRDSAQQGAVSREGLAALDPLNGAPYEWNPGRDRGSVVHTLFVTPTGLYLGGDTDTVNFQQKGKLAFFPLQGGTSVPAPTPVSLPVDIRTAQANGDLTMRSYDGDTATPATVVAGTGIDWSTVRGATLEAGNLYYTLSDSRLYRRSFDGTTFGPAEDLISGVYAGTAPSLVDVTSMTWSDGRLYFTRSGQSALFYRYVSLESGIIGSQTFSIPSQPTGFQPVGTTGMEVIGDHLYYTRIDGNLRRIQMANGAPVPGTVELLSGPLVDGQTWTGTDFFVSGEIDAPPTVDITAPADGATVEGSVAITATADDDNGVDSVEFRVDGVSVGTDTNGNDGWSVDWDTTTTTNANHTISAIATDTGNQTGTDAVDVLVANVGEPTVLFSGTVDSTSATGPRWTSTIYTPTVSGPDQLTLDWDGPANLRFDIRVAGTNAWVGANTTTDQPKTISANLTAGTQYRIAVWSMSGAAEFTVTSGASVPDDELPTVAVTAPTDGATVSGTVAITADANDDNGMDSVEFSVDGTSVGTDTDGSNGWSVDWDTTAAANGAHEIEAVATDTGNQTDTDTIGVTVDNGGDEVEGRPVILISVDGLRSSVLEEADVPNWDRLAADGASTLNARTVVESTQTMPNHSSMFTGRAVAGAGGHGVDFNDDDGSTIHDAAGSYVASIFDAVHDAGMATSFYTQKEKMAFFDRSWNADNGGSDTNGADDGTDKLDVYLRANAAAMVAAVQAELDADPAELTVIHFGETDFAGHDHGWESPEYEAAVELVDSYIGQILDDIEADPDLSDAVVILTADHGGTGSLHGTPTVEANFTIPFAVWGDGVGTGLDLYSINPNRTDPVTAQPPYSGSQPIRNGDAANLVTDLHGLSPISGSTINPDGDLQIDGTPTDVPPTVAITAPTDGATVSGTVAITADANDDDGVDSVEFSVDGTPVGTDTDGSNGWSVDWDTTAAANGAHEIEAVATDTGNQTDTDTIGVTVDNGGDPTVLFVVGDPASLTLDDDAARDRLESNGYVVEVIDDNVVTSADASGKAFVLVTNSVSVLATNTAFRGVATPVWVAKPYFFDDMGLTGPVADVDYGSRLVTVIDIVAAGEPMAGGLDGAVALRSGSYRVSFGVVPDSATVVATALGDPTVFYFESGALLADGNNAAACRLSFPLFVNAVRWYNDDAWAMFDAAADFASSGCG